MIQSSHPGHASEERLTFGAPGYLPGGTTAGSRVGSRRRRAGGGRPVDFDLPQVPWREETPIRYTLLLRSGRVGWTATNQSDEVSRADPPSQEEGTSSEVQPLQTMRWPGPPAYRALQEVLREQLKHSPGGGWPGSGSPLPFFTLVSDAAEPSLEFTIPSSR